MASRPPPCASRGLILLCPQSPDSACTRHPQTQSHWLGCSRQQPSPRTLSGPLTVLSPAFLINLDDVPTQTGLPCSVSFPSRPPPKSHPSPVSRLPPNPRPFFLRPNPPRTQPSLLFFPSTSSTFRTRQPTTPVPLRPPHWTDTFFPLHLQPVCLRSLTSPSFPPTRVTTGTNERISPYLASSILQTGSQNQADWFRPRLKSPRCRLPHSINISCSTVPSLISHYNVRLGPSPFIYFVQTCPVSNTSRHIPH